MLQFPKFGLDCLILSICSAIGQLFIFFTIAHFGAVAFIIIMTLRQAMAIILSCFIYGHFLSATGVIGMYLVFGSVFLEIYCSHKLRRLKATKAQQNLAQTIK